MMLESPRPYRRAGKPVKTIFPTTRRYKIELAAGVIVGFLAMVTINIEGGPGIRYLIHQDAMYIPFCCYDDMRPGILSDLRHQAYALRLVQFIFDKGLTFILVPTTFMLAYAKFDELCSRHRILFCLSRSILTFTALAACYLLVYSVSTSWEYLPFEAVLLRSWTSFLNMFFGVWYCPFSYVAWFLTFCFFLLFKEQIGAASQKP